MYENVSLAEVKEIASKLDSQRTRPPQKSSHPSQGNSEQPESTEPLYSKVQKKRSENICTDSDPVVTGFNPNNPFLGNHEIMPTSQNSHMISQSTILANMVDPLSGGFDPNLKSSLTVPKSRGFDPNPESTSIDPKSGGFDPNLKSTSMVPNSGIFDPNPKSSSMVPKSQSHTQTPSKILPVSFGTPNNRTHTPNPISNSANSHPTSVSQNQNVRPIRKPPVPAPRKPAIPPRRPVTLVTPAPTHNGQSHLSPPYSLPTNGGSAAPSNGPGFIHKSKEDRAKFTETVNKALGSLPQNPQPAIKPKKSSPVRFFGKSRFVYQHFY